jgi:hypothetical protein
VCCHGNTITQNTYLRENQHGEGAVFTRVPLFRCLASAQEVPADTAAPSRQICPARPMCLSSSLLVSATSTHVRSQLCGLVTAAKVAVEVTAPRNLRRYSEPSVIRINDVNGNHKRWEENSERKINGKF